MKMTLPLSFTSKIREAKTNDRGWGEGVKHAWNCIDRDSGFGAPGCTAQVAA
jgi:hypothetical protein